MLRILFQSNLIRRSVTQSPFKDTQRAGERSKNSENIRTLGNSEGTQAHKTLRHLDTQSIREYGQSRYFF